MASLYIDVTREPSNLKGGETPQQHQQNAYDSNDCAEQDQIATYC